MALPCQGKNLRDVLPRASSVCLSAPLDRVRKMLLADFCNRLTTRAPVDRLIPERVAFASPTAFAFERELVGDRGASPPCGDPAPGGARLTARCPSFGTFRPRASLSLLGVKNEDRSRDPSSPRRCRPRAKLANDL